MGFDGTHGWTGGAPDDVGVAVAEVDVQGGVGDVDGDGLAGVASSEDEFLAGDHGDPGRGDAALNPDGFDAWSRRSPGFQAPRRRWSCCAVGEDSASRGGVHRLVGSKNMMVSDLARMLTWRPARTSAARTA